MLECLKEKRLQVQTVLVQTFKLSSKLIDSFLKKLVTKPCGHH
jgi:hypothetical protein